MPVIEQADHDRQGVHRLEDALEVALLEPLELGHRRVEAVDRLLLVGSERLAGIAPRLRPGGDARDQDRVAHDLEPLALAEHVLGAAQADALGAVAAGLGGLLGLVGIGPHAHAPDPVGPAEDLLELGLVLEPRADGGDGAQVDLPGRAIEADLVAFLEAHAGVGRAGGLGGIVDDELRATGNARLADLARHDGGVAGGAAAVGEDALGHGHAV